MRIFVSILRNCLPPTEIVWALPEIEIGNGNGTSHFTIAKLLANISETIPLEAEEWGLEDYAVEVGGYECIHYMPVEKLLKDGDHVVIRPLETPDIRARVLGGRTQISGGGVHLIDGVPFGRNRGPERPPLSIPSKKRARSGSLIYDSQDFTQNASSISSTGAETSLLLTPGSSESTSEPAKKKRRLSSDSRVRFDKTLLIMESSDDDEDDEDYQDMAVDDSDEDDEDDEEEGYSDKEDVLDLLKKVKKVDKEDKSEFSDSDSDSSGSSSDSDSDSDDSDDSSEDDSDDSVDSSSDSSSSSDFSSDSSDSDSEDNPASKPAVSKKKRGPTPKDVSKANEPTINSLEAVSAKEILPPVLPGSGTKATQTRNQRRKAAKKLRELEASRQLPIETGPKDAVRDEESLVHASASEPQPLDVNEITKEVSSPIDESVTFDASTSPEVSVKRPKFDMSPAQRMIYGSLGVRPPKNEDEAQKLSEKLRQRRVSNPSPQTKALQQTLVTPLLEDLANVPPESDTWRSKLDISAVDCETNEKLHPFPYPYQRGWRSFPLENQDVVTIEVQSLNADEVVEDESYYPLKERHEDTKWEWEQDLDLPSKEEEFQNLPNAEIKDYYYPGAVIAFQLMEMSPTTDFQPQISKHRVAKVLHMTGDSIEIQYAMNERNTDPLESSRDTQAKRIDMLLGVDADKDENGFGVVWIPGLINAKIIRHAPQQEEATAEAHEHEDKEALAADLVGHEQEQARNTSSEPDSDEEQAVSGVVPGKMEINKSEEGEGSFTSVNKGGEDGSDPESESEPEAEMSSSLGGSQGGIMASIRGLVHGAFQGRA